MRRVILTACAVMATTSLVATTAFAQMRSSVALHIGEASKAGRCVSFDGLADCDAIITSNPNFDPAGGSERSRGLLRKGFISRPASGFMGSRSTH